MNQDVRQRLRDIVAEYGPSIAEDVRRCEGLLRDLCAGHKTETNILVIALKNRVPVDLLSASSTVPTAVLIPRLTKHLQESFGLAEESARWAVESWAFALGVPIPPTVFRPEPPGEEEARQSVEARARQWFDRGVAAADVDEQLRFYNEAIRLKPDYAYAFCLRGLARHAKGDDVDGALQDYNEAIRLRPDYADAFCNRGHARDAKGDVEGALQDYNEAIRLGPDDADAFHGRGIARRSKGDVEGALQDFNEAIRLRPDDAHAFNNRGIARSAKGDVDGALQDYNEAIRLKPDFADAFNNRAIACSAKGDVDGALQDYNEAIRLKPASFCARPSCINTANVGFAVTKQGEAPSVVTASSPGVQSQKPMSWWMAVLITVAILGFWMFIISFIDEKAIRPMGIVFSLGFAIWAQLDGKRINLGHYKTRLSAGGIGAFMFFLWPVAFPSYLVVRSKIKTGNMPKLDDVGPAPSGSVVRVLAWVGGVLAIIALVSAALFMSAGNTIKNIWGQPSTNVTAAADAKVPASPPVTPASYTQTESSPPPSSVSTQIDAPTAAQVTGSTNSNEAPPPTTHPSFDCEKARTFSEKLICSDAGLSKADYEMAAAYKGALSITSQLLPDQPKSIKESQIAWLKEVQSCTDRQCLATAYANRQAVLASYVERR